MQNKVLTTDSAQNLSAYSGTKKASLLDIIQQKDSLIEQQKRQIETLKEALILSRVKRFSRSSEQSDGQYSLFDEAETEVYEEEQVTESSSPADTKDSSNKEQKKTTGRKPFSKDLPRVPVYLDLTEEEKAGASKVFYTKVKEELDIIPAKIQVLEYFQQKAIFNQVDDKKTFSLKAAILPKHPFPKAMGSINLMAHVIIAKYADGLPLYRLEGILQRYGGEMSRATLANWIIQLAKPLQPLINLLRESQISGDIIQMDETTLKVLKEPDI